MAGSGGIEREKRQAIVWVSGLGEATVDQTAIGIATRIAIQLDRHSATARARFNIKSDTRQERFGTTQTAEVCTIQRRDGDQERPVLDLYRLPSESTLTKGWMQRGAVVKAILVLLTTLRYIPKSVPVFFTGSQRAKTRRERRQLLLARLALLLLFGYALVLLLALVTTATPWLDDAERWAQGTFLGLTVAGIWKGDFVRGLSRAAVQNYCVMQYLDAGFRADVLRGHLEALVEHLTEHDTVDYTTIDVMAYSFGTIVSIDTLFPGPSEPPQRLKRVRTLVTIACPFDLMRTYWRAYFDERYIVAGAPGRWINVYLPIDVLASNFRNDSKQEQPERTVGVGERGAPPQSDRTRPENHPYLLGGRSDQLSPIETLLLVGLRSHASYWGHEPEDEATVFGMVVRAVYAGDPLMV